MAKPSKQQIASVQSALREIHAELLAWDPHVLVSFNGEEQKAQIIARMSQLGWHLVNDPSNETADVSMVEFSLDATSRATIPPPRNDRVRRAKFPASFFASFGVISAIVGIVMAVTTIYTDYRMGLLHKAGTLTTGTIERTYFESNRSVRTYYVSYRFIDTRGIPHENDDAYPFDDWNILRQGDAIGVVYLADDPQRNNLSKRVKLVVNRNPKDEIIGISVPWIIAGCFFLGYWVRRRTS